MVIKTDKGILDIYEGIKYPFNYAIGDVRDITKRNIDFSKTIKLPATKNNNKFFEFYFSVNIQSGSFNINEREFITVEQDGNVVFKGFLQLLSINVSEEGSYYEAVVFSSFRNILDIVEGLDLNDLDFSEYNHIFNATTFGYSNFAPRKNYKYVSEGGGLVNVNDGYGYVYPYISYNGNLEFIDPTTTSFPNMKPSFFVREYIDKIFLLVGFKIESKFFDTNYFKSLILPFTNGMLSYTNEEAEKYIVNYSKSSQEYEFDFSGFGFQQYNTFNLSFNNEIKDDELQYDTLNNVLTSTKKGKYNIVFDSEINIYFEGIDAKKTSLVDYQKIEIILEFINSSQEDVILDTLLNTSDLPIRLKDIPPSQDFFSYTYSTGNMLFEDISLEVGDEIRLKIRGGAGFYQEITTPLEPIVDYELTLNDASFKYELTEDSVIELDDFLNVEKALPKFKITDFLKSIITMFNLYIYPKDGYDNTLIIETRDEFYNGNRTHFFDSKLDISKGYKISTLSEESAKTYLYKYKDGKDYITKEYKANNDGKTYAQKEVITNNQFLTKTQSYTTSFAATGNAIVEFSNIAGRQSAPVIFDRELDEETISIKDDYKYKEITSEPRILFYEKGGYASAREKGSYPSFTLDFEAMKESSAETWTPYFDLYNLFHKNTIEEVSSPNAKLLTCYLNFKVSEIFIGDKIYLLGEYWRINKIIDYDANSNDSTKVELFKLKGNVNYLTAEQVIEQEESNTGLFNTKFNEKFS